MISTSTEVHICRSCDLMDQEKDKDFKVFVRINENTFGDNSRDLFTDDVVKYKQKNLKLRAQIKNNIRKSIESIFQVNKSTSF
jgi:hypothetical protein